MSVSMSSSLSSVLPGLGSLGMQVSPDFEREPVDSEECFLMLLVKILKSSGLLENVLFIVVALN